MKLQNQGNIYLLGFMGSGKSTVAPLLANRLKRAFFDSDDWIEKQAGKSITEIFHDFGEDYFRNLESEAIKIISKMDNLVVALGGGAILRPENWIKIKDSGVTIYLKCSPEVIFNRIKGQQEIRPLLMGEAHQKLNKIRTLLAEREPYYSQADLIINYSQGDSVAKMVNRIKDELEVLI